MVAFCSWVLRRLGERLFKSEGFAFSLANGVIETTNAAANALFATGDPTSTEYEFQFPVSV